MHQLEEKIGYVFKNKELLKEALRHSSYLNEDPDTSHFSNERLEFLGDSVLGVTAAEYLFKKYPTYPEGQLSHMRAALVCEKSLDVTATNLNLGSYLQFGRGEILVGGSKKPSVIADAVEALIGAIYLDAGFETAQNFIRTQILQDEEYRIKAFYDYKTALQEYVQRDVRNTITYTLLGEEGPEHDKTFYSCVELNGKQVGKGKGRNKKESQQEAAKEAMKYLGAY